MQGREENNTQKQDKNLYLVSLRRKEIYCIQSNRVGYILREKVVKNLEDKIEEIGEKAKRWKIVEKLSICLSIF